MNNNQRVIRFYIFLDIDGVLSKGNDPRFYLDPALVLNFKNFLEWLKLLNLEPYIILSSDWRRDEKAMSVLHEAGIEWQDITRIKLSRTLRNLDILRYLEDHDIKEHYLIIDDEDLDFPSRSELVDDYHVQPNPLLGFNDEMLNESKEWVLNYFKQQYDN